MARRSRDKSTARSDADDDGADTDNDVSVDQDGDVAIVTLRRPPHNLLTEPVLRALADAVAGLEGVGPGGGGVLGGSLVLCRRGLPLRRCP